MNKSDKKTGFIPVCVKGLLTLLLAIICITSLNSVNARAEDDDWVHYYGIVTADLVNVRSGPGTKYDKITDDNGKALQVVGQQQLIILDEAKSDDGVTWYKIQFEKGGKTYEGFSSGSYIAKDESKGVITPSPTPAPTNTPTPSPTPVELLTNTPAAPTKALSKDTDKNVNQNDSKTTKTIIIIILIIFVLFVGFFIFLSMRKNKRRNAVRSSRKVDRIRRYEQENVNNGNPNAGKRRPEIRRSAEEEAYMRPARKEVYYTNELNDEEDILASLNKETDTKRQLRAAIDNLQEHDIITHVVYGEGEVYDNSDVKLIEVRFGNDVRFLNKESLVNKGLIQVVDEEEQAVARRRSRRKKKE